MEQKRKTLFEERADIFKALAHPARLIILDELSNGEKCVCELTEAVGLDISTVSKHLSLLKSLRIVSDRKKGTSIHYTLCLPCAQRFIQCVDSFLQKRSYQQSLIFPLESSVKERRRRAQ